MTFWVAQLGTPAGEVYRFGGVSWPTREGARLGAAGAWNFLLRLGLQPRLDGWRAAAEGDVVFACLDGPLESDEQAALTELVQRCRVVVSGSAEGFARLGYGGTPERAGPYAGLAYRWPDEPPALVAPPGWSFLGGCSGEGELLAVSGERQSPGRALLEVRGPALVSRGNLTFLNGSPFQALQAWLQGQEDLVPWLGWRHRLFWLDEWVADLARRLRARQLLPPPGPSRRTTVVLRHDLDFSRDTAYLEAEARFGFPGVHAVLRDRNASFWLSQLHGRPEHECAFHYNTGRSSRWENWLRRRLGLAARPYRPAFREVSRHGLLRQVRWAQRRGVGVATLHRHLAFLVYPEWVDGLDCVFREEAGVLGGSSLFRGQVLRWGVDRADGGRGTYADFPEAQFPYWHPFRLAHAGDGGRLLRGWESASLMEVEAPHLEQLLDHRVPGLDRRVLVLNYHPAHARTDRFFSPDGRANFQRVLEVLRAREVQVQTLSGVYSSL